MSKVIISGTKNGKYEEYICDGKNEALEMIHSGKFARFSNVIITVDGEMFNLNSVKARNYFGDDM